MDWYVQHEHTAGPVDQHHPLDVMMSLCLSVEKSFLLYSIEWLWRFFIFLCFGSKNPVEQHSLRSDVELQAARSEMLDSFNSLWKAKLNVHSVNIK